MFKFEMTVGWLGTGSIKIETTDFDVIETLKDFIEFQESQSWCGAWEESEFDEDEDEEGDDGADCDDETPVVQ
jgi:hypothetical protein